MKKPYNKVDSLDSKIRLQNIGNYLHTAEYNILCKEPRDIARMCIINAYERTKDLMKVLGIEEVKGNENNNRTTK